MGLIFAIKEEFRKKRLRQECVDEIRERVEEHLAGLNLEIEEFFLTPGKVDMRVHPIGYYINPSRKMMRLRVKNAARIKLEELKENNLYYETEVKLVPGLEKLHSIYFDGSYEWRDMPTIEKFPRHRVAITTNPDYERDIKISEQRVLEFGELITSLERAGRVPPKPDRDKLQSDARLEYQKALIFWEAVTSEEWKKRNDNNGGRCTYCQGTGEDLQEKTCGFCDNGYITPEQLRTAMQPSSYYYLVSSVQDKESQISRERRDSIEKLLEDSPILRPGRFADVYITINQI